MSVKSISQRSGLLSKGLYSYYPFLPPDAYIRNPYWPLVIAPVGDEILALYAVYPGFPTHMALQCSVSSGQYRVQLGDGTDTNVASATQFNATISYSNANLYSDPGLPYKIATVRLTPVTGGATFTNIDLSKRNPILTATNPNSNWLETRISFTGTSTVLLADSATASCKAQLLENVEVIGGNWTTSTGSFLSKGCVPNVRRVSLSFNNSSSFTLNGMFWGCHRLSDVKIEARGAGKPNNCGDMFYNCFSLVYAPLFDTSAVTVMTYMFQNCYSITSIPIYNTQGVNDMTAMFQACSSLVTIPILDTRSVTTMQHMFRYCYDLTTIPLLNTINVTNMNNMFYQCYALINIPLINTANVTDMSSMFFDCQSLTTIPALNTSKVTTMNLTFNNNLSLVSLPPLTTTAVTNVIDMFKSSRFLNEIPAMSFAGVSSSGNFATMLSGCMVSRIAAFGARFTHTIGTQSLSGTALDEYYTNLPTVSAQTLTVSGNYGTATDTPTIATAKGWTLTGSLLVFEPQIPVDPKEPPPPPILVGPRNGFYKWQSDENILVRAGEFVHGPGFDLYAVDHDTYQLPIDGWYWFDDEPQARTFLNVPIDALFQE